MKKLFNFFIRLFILFYAVFTLKDRVHCFSMQVIMNKCFLLNPEKKFGANPSCRFRDKRTFNSEK